MTVIANLLVQIFLTIVTRTCIYPRSFKDDHGYLRWTRTEGSFRCFTALLVHHPMRVKWEQIDLVIDAHFASSVVSSL